MVRRGIAAFALFAATTTARDEPPPLRTADLAVPALASPPDDPQFRYVLASRQVELRYDALWNLDAEFTVQVTSPDEVRLSIETAGEPLREVARDVGGADRPPLRFKRSFAAGATSRLVVTTRSTGAVAVQIAVAESPDSKALAKRLRPRSPAECAEWREFLAYASRKIEGARSFLDEEQQARLAKALAGASESPDRAGELFAAFRDCFFQTDKTQDLEFWDRAARFARVALPPDAEVTVKALVGRGVTLANSKEGHDGGPTRDQLDQANRDFLDEIRGREHLRIAPTNVTAINARANLARTCFAVAAQDSTYYDAALVPAATAATAAARALSKKERDRPDVNVVACLDATLQILDQSAPFATAPRAAIRCLSDELSREPEKLDATRAGIEWRLAKAEAELLDAAGDLDGSLDRYGELIEGARKKAAPSDAERWLARFERARILHRVGARRSAQREFEALLEKHPDGVSADDLKFAQMNLRIIRMSKEDVDAAISAIDVPTGSEPDTIAAAREVAQKWSNLVRLLLERGEESEALEASKEALAAYAKFPADFRDPDWIAVQIGRAEALVRAGSPEEAAAFERDALANWRDVSGGWPDEARTLLNNHCFTLRRLKDWKGLAASLAELAQAESTALDCLPALSTFEVTAAVQQRSNFLDTLLTLTRELRLAVERDPTAGVDANRVGDLDRACFELVESFRTTWADDARRLHECTGSPRLFQLLQEWRLAGKVVAGLVATRAHNGATPSSGEELSLALAQRDDLARRLSLGLEHAGSGRRHFDSRRFEQGLAADEAAVSFHVYQRDLLEDPDSTHKPRTKPTLCAFVSRRDGVRRIDGFGDDYSRIEHAVGAWMDGHVPESVRGPAGTKSAGTSPSITSLLLAPILPHLPDGGLLYLCPDGCLAKLPFEAVELPKSKSSDPAVCVADRFAVLYEPSLVGLADAPREGVRPPSLLVMGRPDFEPDAWTKTGPDAERPIGMLATQRGGRLGTFDPGGPAMESEANAVAKGFSDHFKVAADLRVGGAATKEGFVEAATNARFLHLATHADCFASCDELLEEEVATRAPLSLTVLAFTGANLCDPHGRRVFGLLSAEEVAGLDLGGCELAVVAACKSAAGVSLPGQGVASLQSAFHVAGARNVITALWSAHDTSSERFMRRFYEHLWSDADAPVRRRAVLDAFRAARDELRQQTGIGVVDWACFVLSGRG